MNKTAPQPEAIDLASMTSEQLEQLIAKKRDEERRAQRSKRSEYIKRRDDFIRNVVSSAIHVSEQLQELKRYATKTGNELHDLMYEVFDKKPKEMKSFSLDTEDGRHRVTIESAERQAMDETAEVAIGAIKDILREKFEARNKTVFNMMDKILMKNSKGDYDERLVAKLRSFEPEINDPRFSKALDDLADAYYTYGSAIYVRIYIRNEETNRWEPVPMQFSSL